MTFEIEPDTKAEKPVRLVLTLLPSEAEEIALAWCKHTDWTSQLPNGGFRLGSKFHDALVAVALQK